jgi:ABC-type nickel/cobalt efflux system permease component RcnA
MAWGKNFCRTLRRFVALAGCCLLVSPGTFAHPMGNFSISHYTEIRVERGSVELRYLIDMAEIPTFQEMQQNGFAAQTGDARTQDYLSRQAGEFSRGLSLALDGKWLQLQISSQSILFTTGAGGLPTMKFAVVYRARMDCPATHCELEYRDLNFPARIGWKEIIASAENGVTIDKSSVPSRDRSGQLTNYPTDLISSPPSDVTAKVIFSAGTGTSAGSIEDPHEPRRQQRFERDRATEETHPKELMPNRQSTPRNAFTELISAKTLTLGVVLVAALIAAGLGALHALEPGHGKTIVAAYLVGSKGTPRHALLLGLIVTTSHTAGVYLLGGITLYAQKYVLPDRIYPFLGFLSGILTAGMGCYLFLQRLLGAEFLHQHEIPNATPIESRTDAEQQRSVSARQLFVLGTTGGIVPCPAALVVLLSAVALHRTGFGLFLIVAFSLGLAGVLITMGMAAVYAGRMVSRLPTDGPLVQRWLPMGSAAMIAALGCVIAVRSLVAAGVFP